MRINARPIAWFLTGALGVLVVSCAAGVIYFKAGAHGFSARARPTSVEKFAAREARSMAAPSDAKTKTNPVPNSQQVITEGMAHWADHCAVCHSNDGSGQTLMGQNMYPPAPDMRKRESQGLTDGELFYVIENGIRLSGMPAWGNGSKESEDASWKLVRFIRRLPDLPPEDVERMEKLNPKSPDELREEQEEDQFLSGQPSKGTH
ncbi:MAG TPA: c-type cytochrome [Bryobacteraceae bacterium]|jgi:mono/diheme cytochrome c family protein|nr:c-type cytochrome [Bryobacteraceae bacterium]